MGRLRLPVWARAQLQVLHSLALSRIFRCQGRPLRFPLRDAPKTASIVWDTWYEWQDHEWMSTRQQKNAFDAPMSIYEVHLGSWMRVPEEGNRSLTYRELATQACRLREAARLHPRRVHAHHGASVLRLVGIPDHRLLRSQQPLWHAAGFHVPGRPSAPERHRRHSRLGAFALSQRRARASVF